MYSTGLLLTGLLPRQLLPLKIEADFANSSCQPTGLEAKTCTHDYCFCFFQQSHTLEKCKEVVCRVTKVHKWSVKVTDAH